MPENNRKSMFADNVVGEVVDTATGQTRVLRSKPAPNREVALQDSERATAGSVPTDAGGSAEPPARDRLEAVLADEPLPSYMDGAAESEKAVYSAAKRIKAERDELRAELEQAIDGWNDEKQLRKTLCNEAGDREDALRAELDRIRHERDDARNQIKTAGVAAESRIISIIERERERIADMCLEDRTLVDGALGLLVFAIQEDATNE